VLRRLFTLKWLLTLLLSLVAAAVMVRLGYWQLGRGERRHSLQNYSYAVEWVLFAAFTLFCYVKLLRDEGREPEPEADPVQSGVVVPPPAATAEPQDDELAAYNAYLARLNGS
jgi:DNA-binding transcriptional regulator of glucitol operon